MKKLILLSALFVSFCCSAQPKPKPAPSPDGYVRLWSITVNSFDISYFDYGSSTYMSVDMSLSGSTDRTYRATFHGFLSNGSQTYFYIYIPSGYMNWSEVDPCSYGYRVTGITLVDIQPFGF